MSKLSTALLCLARLLKRKEAAIALAEMSISTVDEDLAQLKKERVQLEKDRREFLELARAKEPRHCDLCLLWREGKLLLNDADEDAIAFLEDAINEDRENCMLQPWCFASPFTGCHTCMAINYYLSP